MEQWKGGVSGEREESNREERDEGLMEGRRGRTCPRNGEAKGKYRRKRKEERKIRDTKQVNEGR